MHSLLVILLTQAVSLLHVAEHERLRGVAWYQLDLGVNDGCYKGGHIHITDLVFLPGVAYLVSTDNVSRPLSTRLHRANQPILTTRNVFSRPRPTLLTCL